MIKEKHAVVGISFYFGVWFLGKYRRPHSAQHELVELRCWKLAKLLSLKEPNERASSKNRDEEASDTPQLTVNEPSQALWDIPITSCDRSTKIAICSHQNLPMLGSKEQAYGGVGKTSGDYNGCRAAETSGIQRVSCIAVHIYNLVVQHSVCIWLVLRGVIQWTHGFHIIL